MTTVFTIGHSTRTHHALIALLRRSAIRHVVDVRRFPGSRRLPHLAREPLAGALGDAGIAYTHAPVLGGRRRPHPESPHRAWRNAGVRGYADWMDTAAFRRAIDTLGALGARTATAILCAEAVPWRCHRWLIADALVAAGMSVEHILDDGTRAHRLSPFAVVRDGRVAYPPPAAPAPKLFG